jgi:hypothetical protein
MMCWYVVAAKIIDATHTVKYFTCCQQQAVDMYAAAWMPQTALCCSTNLFLLLLLLLLLRGPQDPAMLQAVLWPLLPVCRLREEGQQQHFWWWRRGRGC